MSKLFVANCTRQVQEIHYRLDFSAEGVKVPFTPATRQTIQPGHQVLVAGKDLHMQQVQSIIQQLSRFGMVDVSEVSRIRRKLHQVFSLDKPVSVTVIRNIMDANVGTLTIEGQNRRRNAAVATNELIAQSVTNDFAARGIPKEPTQQVDVEFEQLEQSEAGERRIEEGYRVRDNATGEPPPGKRSRRSRIKQAA